jgi:hypothetical protein
MGLGSKKPRDKTVIKCLEEQRLTSTGEMMYKAFILKMVLIQLFIHQQCVAEKVNFEWCLLCKDTKN